jgi:hypothetical protein
VPLLQKIQNFPAARPDHDRQKFPAFRGKPELVDYFGRTRIIEAKTSLTKIEKNPASLTSFIDNHQVIGQSPLLCSRFMQPEAAAAAKRQLPPKPPADFVHILIFSESYPKNRAFCLKKSDKAGRTRLPIFT